MIIEFAVRSVGETVGDICVEVGEGDGAAAGIEVISGVCSIGLLPNEPEAVDVIGGARALAPIPTLTRSRIGSCNRSGMRRTGALLGGQDRGLATFHQHEVRGLVAIKDDHP